MRGGAGDVEGVTGGIPMMIGMRIGEGIGVEMIGVMGGEREGLPGRRRREETMAMTCLAFFSMLSSKNCILSPHVLFFANRAYFGIRYCAGLCIQYSCLVCIFMAGAKAGTRFRSAVFARNLHSVSFVTVACFLCMSSHSTTHVFLNGS